MLISNPTMSPSDRTQTELLPDEALLGLPFDQYERYALTAQLVHRLWPATRRPLRVLDVGGNSSPLKHLLPGDEVTLADIEPPGSLKGLPLLFDRYVQASGAALPFADGTFDVVAAHDTLEHVPPAFREPFLQELARVSRRLVVVNGPVYHPHTVRAERLLARFIGQARTDERRFIAEHLQLGLPDREQVEAIFRAAGLRMIGIPNGRLPEWLGMHLARQLTSLLPTDRLGEGLDRAFNRLLAPTDFGGVCYREAFVISLEPDDAVELEQAASAMTRLAATPAEEEALAAALSILEEHVEGIPSTRRGGADVAELERKLADLEVRHERITRSSGVRLMQGLYRLLDRIAPWGTRRRSFFLAPGRALRIAANRGVGQMLAHLLKVWVWVPNLWRRALPPVERLTVGERYELWLRLQILSKARLRAMRRQARKLSHRPLITIVTRVFDTRPEHLRAAIESVRAQVYPEWELVLVDDGSSRADTLDVLRAYDQHDPRIRVRFLEVHRGAPAASNAGIELANGEFVGFLDHDDELKPNALFELARLLNEQRDLDFIYSDEDKVNPDGRMEDPFFKPDWSPDLALTLDYVSHLSVFRRELLGRIGGMREGFDGAQDYDLVLRVTEATDRIAHVPLPLYSWRKGPGAVAGSDETKPHAYQAAKRAAGEALERRGYRGEILDGPYPGYLRARYELIGEPRVSIIVPTRDRVDLLRRCIESIGQRSTYANYELLVVDNDSQEPRTERYLESVPGRVIRYPDEFNFSRIVNLAAAEAEGEILVFLNNDTEVINPDWIEAMLEHAQRPEVAAVGSRLLFPDGSPQHEGIIVGPGRGLAENAVRGGYFGLDRSIHNCSAVTAACMMVRKEVFLELGGFEERLRVAYNDVDFCLRAREKGYLVVYTPYALLYHDEGSTRSRFARRQPVEDEELFRARWAGYRDPYYNPNLDLEKLYALRLDV